jgi:hypothetical protein
MKFMERAGVDIEDPAVRGIFRLGRSEFFFFSFEFVYGSFWAVEFPCEYQPCKMKKRAF